MACGVYTSMKATMNEELIHWKREADGTYLAVTSHYWIYEIGRYDTGRDSGWYLKAWPAGHADEPMEKRGFSKMNLARHAVMSTLCSRCMHHFPFRTLELGIQGGGTRFICRDKEACINREAERNVLMTPERRDHDEIKVRDGRYGPELVFTKGNHSTVINVTENDLDYIQGMLARRSITALAGATDRCPECFVPKGSHHKMDCSQRGGGVVYGADPVPDADGGS